MKRIVEELTYSVVLAPQEVASATPKTSAFADAQSVPEIEFLVATGALAKGKKLKVEVYTSDEAGGGSPALVKAVEFTAGDGAAYTLAVVDYAVDPARGRYVGVKIQHDAGAGVVCGVTACARSMRLPAANAWTAMV